MGVDSYLLFARKAGVSRAEIEDLLDCDADEVRWFTGPAFSVFSGIRFGELESSDQERRIRLALEHVSLELFERIEPFAVAYPDVADYDEEDSLEVVLADPTSLRIDFKDFVPGDERMDQAAQDEQRQVMASVNAMMAFTRYQEKDAAFAAEFGQIAESGNVAAMIARARAVPELAPQVDAMVKARFFESYALTAKMSRQR